MVLPFNHLKIALFLKLRSSFQLPTIKTGVIWSCRLKSACHLFVHDVCLQDSWSETITESFSLHSPNLSQLNTLIPENLNTLTRPGHVASIQSRIHSQPYVTLTPCMHTAMNTAAVHCHPEYATSQVRECFADVWQYLSLSQSLAIF